MNKTFMVIKEELNSNFRRPSYLILAFGLPFLIVIITVGIQVFRENRPTTAVSSEEASTDLQFDVEGYVDLSGIIQSLPDDLPDEKLLSFSSEDQAQEALNKGKISAYYMIPEDYLKRGEVVYVYPDTRSYLSDGQSWVIQWVLMFNILDGDFELANLAWNPIRHLEILQITQGALVDPSDRNDCTRPSAACQSNELVRMMPSIMVLLFYIVFMMSSGMLFNSVGREKENRTIEVLLLSVHPRQLLAGKTIASGIAGLTQTILWLVAIFISLNIGGSTLHLPQGFHFPVSILVWGLVYFLGGFGLYASLMAGAGAMIPRMKETGGANFIAMIPLMVGYMVGLLAPLAEETTSFLPVFLSFFPLTSPVVMIMRLTDGTVSVWHLALSAVLLFGCAYLVFRAAAAMFQAQHLLSGQPFSVKKYLLAMAGYR